MFDIDKHLDEISLTAFSPSDELIRRTVDRCTQAEQQRSKRREKLQRIRKVAFVAMPAAAVLLVGIFIGATFFADQQIIGDQPTAYYTVDINPSVCVNVDSDNLVISLVSQNDDAKALIKDLNCVGKPVKQAIEMIIKSAKSAGYLGSEQKYVLVGYFGADDGVSVQDLQTQLEADFGDLIELYVVSGTLEDKHQADERNVSAGLLKLSNMAGNEGMAGNIKLGDIVAAVRRTYQQTHGAPVLTAKTSGTGIELSWSALDYQTLGITGSVTYQIIAGDTYDQVNSMQGTELYNLTFDTADTQPQSQIILPGDAGIQPGTVKYYGIYAKYNNGVQAVSNVVRYKMPLAATPSPSVNPSATPNATVEPTAKPPAKTGYAVSGQVMGDYLVLSWDKDTSSQLSGYKVVASQTNPNPKYPDDGYLKYITNRDTTAIKLYAGSNGLTAGKTYYFSVTYLYNDGNKVAGNAVKLTMPTATTDPGSGDYVATNISGSISGSTVSLSWGKISSSALEGYKVMYSFTDSTPVYGEDGCNYAKWIENADTTSCSINVTSLSGYTAGATCYFSITALYDNHNVRKAGNVVALEMPAAAVDSYVATTISGGISGSTVNLSWGVITNSHLDGYKVMYSFSNPSPIYGDEGCDYATWITDPNQTSFSVDATGLNGYTPGATCYFSITALYDGHSVKKPGNTISFVIP